MSLSHPLSCWFQWSVFCYILFRSVINNVQCDVNTSEESHWSHSQPSSEAWIKLDCWSILPSFGRWRQNPPCCVTTSKSWRLEERIITKTLITALLLLYLTCMEHVQKLNTLISDITFKITVRCLTMFINIDANPDGADSIPSRRPWSCIWNWSRLGLKMYIFTSLEFTTPYFNFHLLILFVWRVYLYFIVLKYEWMLPEVTWMLSTSIKLLCSSRRNLIYLKW